MLCNFFTKIITWNCINFICPPSFYPLSYEEGSTFDNKVDKIKHRTKMALINECLFLLGIKKYQCVTI